MNHRTTHPDQSRLSRRHALRLLGISGLSLSFAPSLAKSGMAAPSGLAGHYRQQIGALEVYILFDGTLTFPKQAYGVNGPTDRIDRILNANFLPVGPTISIPMNCVVIKSPQGIVLIDAGTGGKGGVADGGRLVANLEQIGIKPEDVNAVIVTHLHPDHIGGLFVGGAATVSNQLVFRRAEHVITKTEWNSLANPGPAIQNRPANIRPFFDTALESFRATLNGRVRFVAPGDQVIPGVEIVDAPGHTVGHVAVRISSGNQQLLHLVDAVAHHVLGFAPELRLLFDEDATIAASTRTRLFDQVATERTLVMGYHFPWPGLAHIRKTPSGFEWVPTVWDWAAQNG